MKNTISFHFIPPFPAISIKLLGTALAFLYCFDIACGNTYILNGGENITDNISVANDGDTLAVVSQGESKNTISGTVSITGTSTFQTGTDLDISGAISGDQQINKTGSGTLAISSNSGYHGTLNISAGTLDLTSGQVFVGYGASFAGAVTVNSGGTIKISNMNWGNTYSLGTLNFNDGTFVLSGGTLQITTTHDSARGFTINNSGTIDIGKDITYTAKQSGSNGKIMGTGNLIKAGEGTFVINQTIAKADFSGNLTVNNGMLDISTGQVYSAGYTSVYNGQKVFINTNGTLKVATTAYGGSLGGLADAQNDVPQISLNGGTLYITSNDESAKAFKIDTNGGTFLVDNTVTLTRSNALQGSGNITKTGEGTLVIKGVNSGFTGTVNIQNGIFQFGASGILPNIAGINLFEGGKLVTNGYYTGTVQVESGAKLTPASQGDLLNASVTVLNGGTITATETVSVASVISNGTFEVLPGDTKLLVTGGALFNSITTEENGTLYPVITIAEDHLTDYGVYTILDAQTISSNFITGSNWEALLADDLKYAWNLTLVNGGNGNQLILSTDFSAVPEPSTWLLLILGCAGLFSLVRSKKQEKQ